MKRKPVSWRDRLFSHAVAIVFCVGFPACVTGLAPVTWMTFTRQHDGRVRMTAKVCMFFVLPFRREEVAEVTGLDQETIVGTREKFNAGTPDDQRTYVTSDSAGFLIVHGRDQEARIAVSPASLSDVERKAGDFLNHTAAADLQLFTVANWKVSVVMGGFVSLFTVLYAVGLLSWLLPSSWLARIFHTPSRSLASGPASRRDAKMLAGGETTGSSSQNRPAPRRGAGSSPL